MKRLCVSLTILLAGLFAVSSTASAATVVKMDMPDLVAQSDAIVIAQVVEYSSQLEEDGRVYTTITFRTDEVLKGQPGEEFTIRQVGGRDGDIATRAPGMPTFEEDEEVFLFLTHHQSTSVVTGLSQGKFHIAIGPDDQTRFVVPQIHGIHLVERGTTADERSEAVKAQGPHLSLQDHASVFRQVHEFQTFRRQVERTIEWQNEAVQ